MANFTTEGRLKSLPDIQRVYMWELFIPSIEELDQDDMVVRCRNVLIPGRTITPIESFFLGTKQFHPGRTEYPGVFTTDIEEFEDQKVHTAIDSWMQFVFDYDPNSPTAGQQKGDSKQAVTQNITLRMYAANGEKLEKEIVYFNAWPQGIADFSLDYTGNDSVKYSITWQYDFWRPKS